MGKPILAKEQRQTNERKEKRPKIQAHIMEITVRTRVNPIRRSLRNLTFVPQRSEVGWARPI